MDSPTFQPLRTHPDIQIDDEPAVLLTPLRTNADVPDSLVSASDGPLSSDGAARYLFGPKLYPRFRHWQSTIGNPHGARHYSSVAKWRYVRETLYDVAIGDLPSPCIYSMFMDRIRHELYSPAWRNEVEEQIALPTDSVRAIICGHTIHPGNPQKDVEVCPVCAMWQCVAALKRIIAALEYITGPKRNGRQRKAEELWHDIRKLWFFEKKKWANWVNEYEDIAVLEEEFAAKAAFQDLDSLRIVEATCSCTAALKLAEQCPLLADGRLGEAYAKEETLEGEMWIREAIQEKQYVKTRPLEERQTKEAQLQQHQQWYDRAKAPRTASSLRITHRALSSTSASVTTHETKVAFASDIVDLPRRPKHQFRRESSEYVRGRHACAPGQSWLDTSGILTANELEVLIAYMKSEEVEMERYEDKVCRAAWQEMRGRRGIKRAIAIAIEIGEGPRRKRFCF